MRTEHDIRYCMTDGVPNEIIKASETPNADQVLRIARHCERLSKDGGPRAAEYKRLAQHLKKSAGHLRSLERSAE